MKMRGLFFSCVSWASVVGADGFYFGLELGRDDNLDSKWIWHEILHEVPPLACDQWFTEALPPEDPECSPRGGVIWNQVAHAGGNPLDPGGSVGTHFGYKGRFFKIEAEWSRRWRSGILQIREYRREPVTQYDSWFDLKVHGITSVRSQGFFLNVYYDLPPVRNITPFLAVGQGILFVDMDYFLLQRFRSDAEVLEYLGAIPQVASSFTILDSNPEDYLQAVQVMAGLDYPLGDQLLVGVKLQWMRTELLRHNAGYRIFRGHEPKFGPDTDRSVRTRMRVLGGFNKTRKLSIGVKWKL